MRDLPAVGATVYWHQFSDVHCGKVISAKRNGGRSSSSAVIERFEGYEIKDVEHLFQHEYEARLDLAKRKQQEAATLLNQAAELFKAGIDGQVKAGTAESPQTA